MNRNLPSQEEVDRYANWGFITVGALAVAGGVPIGLSKLVPGLSFAVEMVIFGVLMIPALVCFGIAVRHGARSLALRKAEQREGRVVYTNRVGRFMDVHPYVVVAIVIGGTVVAVVIWTMLEHK